MVTSTSRPLGFGINSDGSGPKFIKISQQKDMYMLTFMKNIVAVGLLLAATRPMCGMGEWENTDNGFRLRGTVTGQWGPEIPAHSTSFNYAENFNADKSAAIIDIDDDHFAVVVDLATGTPVVEQIPCRNYNHGFSKSGNIAYFYADGITTLVDIEKKVAFEVRGGGVTRDSFSADEKVVVINQRIHDENYQVLINMETRTLIAEIRGGEAIVIPNTSRMIVSDILGRTSGAVLIDMTTGNQIGPRLEGIMWRLSPNGQTVVMQQFEGDKEERPYVAFYSTETGDLLEKVPGLFRQFVPDAEKKFGCTLGIISR